MLVITRQIKAARSLIGWEQHELARSSGVAISTVRRLESLNGAIGARRRTIEKIRAAFEEAGIEFIGDPNPGVCLCSKPRGERQ
jgi:transcriptional regulator with XRE-family HTH domain